MMKKAISRTHAVQDAFVFLLLGIFALFSAIMVLFSVGMYKDIHTQAEKAGVDRILDHYIVNAVRSHDRTASVSFEKRNGTEVLVLTENEDDAAYETLVYLYNGMLTEMFLEAGSEFLPEYGEMIAPASGFSVAMENGLMKIRIIDSQGNERLLSVALRSSGKEAMK